MTLVEQVQLFGQLLYNLPFQFHCRTTAYDTIGCIGTMISTLCNYDGWFEKMGLKLIQAKATKSDLKNKKTDDLLRGNPEQYIKEELIHPMNSSLPPILASRPQLGNLPEDDPGIPW